VSEKIAMTLNSGAGRRQYSHEINQSNFGAVHDKRLLPSPPAQLLLQLV